MNEFEDVPARRQGVRGGADVYAGIAAIRTLDPGFDAGTFLNDVEATFLRVQSSVDGDVAVATPAFAAPWRERLVARSRPGSSPTILDSPLPPTIRLSWVEADPNYDRITVHLTSPAPQGCEFAEFREDWTFVRYHVVAPGDPAIRAQHCPNCGAPFDADPAGRCSYCHALLLGRKFDWRLAAAVDRTYGAQG